MAGSGPTYTITRSTGSWLTDGIKKGQIGRITAGAVNAANLNKNLVVLSLTSTILTVMPLNGVALGLFGTWVDQEARYFQGSLLSNQARSVSGVQFAGGVNWSEGTVQGAQLPAALAYAQSDVRGAQLALGASHRGYVIPSRAHAGDGEVRCLAGFAAALPILREARASGLWTRYLDIPDLGAEERPRSGTPSKESS